MDARSAREQYHFRLDGSMMEDQISSGSAPIDDGTELTTKFRAWRKSTLYRICLKERNNLHQTITPELMELADALREYKMKEMGANGDGRSDGMNGSED